MCANVYQCNGGICPKCGDSLPEHWRDDQPAKPEDTGYIRVCPNCGTKLFRCAQQSNS
jgi:predicted RNA-binding Zn-ribbon protein involved in translation (DUF1610 family)